MTTVTMDYTIPFPIYRLRELVQACHTIRDGALQTDLHRVTGDLPHHLYISG